MLAPYACNPENSRGRKIFELLDLYRDNFQKDRERIIHSNAFKRLEYKTQVFVNHAGDHYRNRLTHSLEVANIAGIIAKKLSLSVSLAESIALAHDIGHAPFGHAGQDALNLCMKEYAGFCHNTFSFKLLTKLEKRYAAFDGLNLSWEVLEGIVKHNGPISAYQESQDFIFKYDAQNSLDLKNYPSAEAQIASISDDIAYNSHDIEDGLRSKMFKIDDLRVIKFFDQHISQLRTEYKDIDDNILSYEVSRIFTKTLVHDLIDTSSYILYNNNIKTLADIQNLNKPVIGFSSDKAELIAAVKQFLYDNLYRHHKIMSYKCKKILTSLFQLYMENSDCMPQEWQNQILRDGNKPQVICDYIAGMTDRYAIKEFESFFNLTSNNI